MVNRLALAGLATIFAVGAWLIAAPFVLRYQSSGAPWTGASRMDVIVGAALVLAGFSGFFTALAGRVRELYAGADRGPSDDSAVGDRAAAGVESLVRDL
jgi:hypothetical protein